MNSAKKMIFCLFINVLNGYELHFCLLNQNLQ